MKRKLSFTLALSCILSASLGQSVSSQLSIPGIPKNLAWDHAPSKWSYSQGQLAIEGGAKTDLFVDPQHQYTVTNSPKALFSPADTFLLSAQVTVPFKTDYDAGVLVVFASKDAWAKLCFEYSPEKKPYVVSVVNNGISDDCNHVAISGNQIFLRISGLGSRVFAFHYSSDGKYWHLVRYFHLNAPNGAKVGFSSQSPTGNACTSTFSQISYSVSKLQDIRNGK